MAIENASFEDAGTRPGEAARWTLSAVCTAEEIAAFGAAPPLAWEGFEYWFELAAAFGESDLVVALFDALPEAREDFAEGWNNEVYLTEWHDGYSEAADFGAGAVEDAEGGWANDAFAWDWEDVPTSAAAFDGGSLEAFVVAGYLWNLGEDVVRMYFPDEAETFSTGGWDEAQTI